MAGVRFSLQVPVESGLFSADGDIISSNTVSRTDSLLDGLLTVVVVVVVDNDDDNGTDDDNDDDNEISSLSKLRSPLLVGVRC